MCGLSTVVTPAGASLTMYREIRSYANSIWDDNTNTHTHTMSGRYPTVVLILSGARITSVVHYGRFRFFADKARVVNPFATTGIHIILLLLLLYVEQMLVAPRMPLSTGAQLDNRVLCRTVHHMTVTTARIYLVYCTRIQYTVYRGKHAGSIILNTSGKSCARALPFSPSSLS